MSAMSDEQMHRMTLFAVGLDRMAKATKAGTGVELDAEETAAMVSWIQLLAQKPPLDDRPLGNPRSNG